MLTMNCFLTFQDLLGSRCSLRAGKVETYIFPSVLPCYTATFLIILGVNADVLVSKKEFSPVSLDVYATRIQKGAQDQTQL